MLEGTASRAQALKWQNEKCQMRNGKSFSCPPRLIVHFRAFVPTLATHGLLSRNPLPCCKNCAPHRLSTARARNTSNRSARDLRPRRSSFPPARQPAPVAIQQKFACCKASDG